MICEKCVKRADSKKSPGCSKPCGDHGCSCQHKAGRRKKDDAKSGESFEG